MILEKMRRAAGPVLCLTLLAAFACGCASSYDNRTHWPMTGASVDKAYRLAEADGLRRVDVGGGEGRWVSAGQLAAYGADSEAMMRTNGPALLDLGIKQRELARSIGRTDAQIVSDYNSSGVGWAKAGDGLILSSILAGIGVAIAKAGGDDGGAAAVPAAPATPTASGSAAVAQNNSGTTIIAAPGATVNYAAGAGDGASTAGSEAGQATAAGKPKK